MANKAAKKIKIDKVLMTLIHMGCKQAGSYNPDDALLFVEESMTIKQSDEARAFLGWVVKNDKQFGHNIAEVYAEFKNGQ